MASQLAILGGPKAVRSDPGDMFAWPIVTPEIEEAVLDVLRRGAMSGFEVTRQLEKEFAAWHGMKYCLGHNTGTQALQAAMYAVGVGHGDEIICPSITYWASCLQCYSLGATVVFADVDPDTVCLDPKDIEHRITPRTKAIVVVHYAAHPADMDPILEIARRHKVAVIEDVSHAHGALYKGRMVGTFGDVAGFSIMSGKSFAAGEGGLLLTDKREIYERALVFGHYARADELTIPEYVAGGGLPWGGYKNRMNQLTSAMARVQLKLYPSEMADIDQAMNYFWDRVGDLPGIRSHRPGWPNSTKGGWYAPHGLYRPEELGGLSITRFCEALRAEGVPTSPGCNKALHSHPLFQTIDVYHAGKPTRIANLPEGVDVRPGDNQLSVSSTMQEHIYNIPWFKHYRPETINEYAEAFHKVVSGYRELLPGDPGNPPDIGGWGLTRRIQ